MRHYTDVIYPLMKKHNIVKVQYDGPVRMMGYSKIMFYDAEFWFADEENSFVVREFVGSPLKKDMQKIIDTLRTRRIPHGTTLTVK